ncbi:hypothetical protein [Pseudomonas sp. St290]|uniref:hypothetical protein n=1 Tax=Pseudomonas sp. St290 TaxID=1602166 RepID=UPI001BB40002|nr:hypothetical protein [Pseudomonas sp. St290]BBH34849.1 hypothetical protein PBDP_4386 [Pseudomonas sp. St290]
MSSTQPIRLDPTMTAPWTEPEPLADIPGGERNLLHRSAWSDPDNPLRVKLKPWYDDDLPGGPWTERVDVFLDDDERNIIGSRVWDLPMDPDDYYVPISADNLPSGTHTFSFIMTNFVDVPARSFPFTVTIDKTPPVLAFSSELLIDPDIIQNGLSEQYLNEHGGIVTVTVPPYLEPAPGDKIVAQWLNENNGQHEEVFKDLDRNNYEDPIRLDFDEALIRRVGDGTRVISYHVFDRAGNKSDESTPVSFLVSVVRAPHFVPHPWITEAEGSPAEYADLNPQNVVAGATAKIPDDAVYYNDDVVHMQFGEPGTAGAIAVPVPWGTKEVRIPPGNIAAMFDKRVPVYYDLVLADSSNKQSRTLTVAISTYPSHRFHVPQLESPFTDPVSKGSITDAGVPVYQRAWAFISDACLVTITVSGKNAQNQTVSQIVLNQHRVQPAEVTAGIRVRLPRAFMSSLVVNQKFTVETQVSFDGGARWTRFDHLTPTLIE